MYVYYVHMSPTLLKLGSYRVVVYPKDHNPPHKFLKEAWDDYQA